jgi:hypothetical protein
MNDDPIDPNPFSSNPQDQIKILQQNVEDIFASIKTIHGPEYSAILTHFFVLYNQIATMESYICECTGAYSRLVDNIQSNTSENEEQLADNRAIAQFHHDSGHMMGEQCQQAISFLLIFIESHLPKEFPDLQKNMEALMNRIRTDWQDKGHG